MLNLEFYSRYTKTADRRAVINVYNGVILIVCATIISQAVSSVGSDRIANFGLGGILLAIYVTVGIIAAGFALIAHGAHNLKPQKPILNNKMKEGIV